MEIWRAKFTLAKLSFFLSRYFGLLYWVLSVIGTLTPTTSLSVRISVIVFLASLTFSTLPTHQV